GVGVAPFLLGADVAEAFDEALIARAEPAQKHPTDPLGEVGKLLAQLLEEAHLHPGFGRHGSHASVSGFRRILHGGSRQTITLWKRAQSGQDRLPRRPHTYKRTSGPGRLAHAG